LDNKKNEKNGASEMLRSKEKLLALLCFALLCLSIEDTYKMFRLKNE
jgi:hypothetical protein